MPRTLEVIQDEVKSCVKCELHKTRTNTVFSRGNPDANLCFVGEAPGQDEDLQGLPFVGKSGRLLDRILASMGIDVQAGIYVCNIIKCRPPDNRPPTPQEIATCIPYLQEQLSLIKAPVVVALGNTAVVGLLDMSEGITKIRGQLFQAHGKIVIPAFHPSYLLRNNNPLSDIHTQFRQDITSALNKIKELSQANANV